MALFNEKLDLLEEAEIVPQSKIRAIKELVKSIPDGQALSPELATQVGDLLGGSRVITGGSFKDVFIGYSKAEVIKGLGHMGVGNITGESKDDVIVSEPVDLHLLNEAGRVVVRSNYRNLPGKEGLARLGFLYATIHYDQHRVARIEFAPDSEFLASVFKINLENTARIGLQQVKSRQQVKEILGPLLDEGMITVSRETVTKDVELSTTEAVVELAGFDYWTAYLELADVLGSLALQMKFENSKLTELRLNYNPFI